MYTAIWAYPWDLLDEGLDESLGRLADAGLQGVSVATAYHHVRALCPHNPKRAVVHGEGGVVYFRPDVGSFADTPLKPVESAMLADGDPLECIGAAAARRGLKVHAWTVLHHNSRLGAAFPECTLENAFGDRYPFGLCPANPAVRAYTLGLVRSLAGRANLDTIELESAGYMGLDHSGHHAKAGVELDGLRRFLLSLCFCPHCARHMAAHGADAARAREAVARETRAFFAGESGSSGELTPETFQAALGEDAPGILEAREEVVGSLLAEVRACLHPPQTLCVMTAPSPFATGAPAGLATRRARLSADRLLRQAFHREADAVRGMVTESAAGRGDTPVFAGLQAIAPFVLSVGELRAQVAAAREAGAEGVQFYHYGLMPLANLEWIRTALD